MTYNLFLDDLRDPPEPQEEWVIARRSEDAITIVMERGMPARISFDHDLGGYDDACIFLNWLIDQNFDAPIPEYQVHSANPVGRERIISKMESWKKARENETGRGKTYSDLFEELERKEEKK